MAAGENGAAKTRKRTPAPQRRAMLLVAAREVFLEGGLSAARTKDIAQRAGVAEAMIYRFFSSKQELFEAAVLEPLELILSKPRHVAQVREAEGDAERLEALRASNEDFLETMQTVVPMLGVALFAQEAGSEFYRDRIVPLLDQWAESTRKALEGWEHTDLDPGLLTRIQFGHGFALALDAFLRKEELDIPSTASDLAEYAYWGIRGPRGVEHDPSGG